MIWLNKHILKETLYHYNKWKMSVTLSSVGGNYKNKQTFFNSN